MRRIGQHHQLPDGAAMPVKYASAAALQTFDDWMGEIPFDKAPDQSLVPEIQRYIAHGIRPSSFIYGLLIGDFGTMLSAAPERRAQMMDWIEWAEQCLPAACWGDKLLVEDWLDLHADPSRYEAVNSFAALPFAHLAELHGAIPHRLAA